MGSFYYFYIYKIYLINMGRAYTLHDLSFSLNNLGVITFGEETINHKIDLGDMLMFSANSVSTDTAGTLLNSPTLINTYDVKVTYSSTNTSVATVNSNGVVTIIGNGQTQIIASFAGNNRYNAKSVMYTITVNMKN